jgi:hypothetical protein
VAVQPARNCSSELFKRLEQFSFKENRFVTIGPITGHNIESLRWHIRSRHFLIVLTTTLGRCLKTATSKSCNLSRVYELSNYPLLFISLSPKATVTGIVSALTDIIGCILVHYLSR